MNITPFLMAARFFAASAGLAFLVSLVSAQSASVGSIEGRVQNSATGAYLNNARVTIEGTNLSTLTNSFGEYRFTGVPTGDAKVTVFYSGMPPQTETVRVAGGQRVVKDFDLTAGPIRLDAFTVASSRAMSAADMATNEQRFAPNMKTVLAADTFGDQTENNVAEFLKLMPALSVGYEEDHANSVSIRGMPAHTTIVTTNGNPVASAASGWSDNTRAVEFEHLSINDVARVEINKSLLPDMPAEGIGGTINLIMKSAFERSRPEFRYRTYLNINSTRTELKKTPGPMRDPSYKIRPGFDFTYVNPLTSNFGFTVGATRTSKYVPMYLNLTTWDLNPDPVTGVENPFVRSIVAQDVPKQITRTSGRIGADWRFAPHDVISIGFSESYYQEWGMNRRFDVNLGADPVLVTREFAQGRPGAGLVRNRGSQALKSSTTWSPEFKWTHNGPEWKFEAATSYSHASFNIRSDDLGFFSSMPMEIGTIAASGTGRVGPTIRFDNTGDYLPTITAVLATGESVNPRSLENSFLTGGSALYRRSTDVKKTLRFHGQRVVDLVVPITIKAGGDARKSLRDRRQFSPNYTFLGPDGIPNTADDAVSLYDLVDPRYSTVKPPYGNPKFQWGDQYKGYEMLVAHPDWWRRNLDTEHNTLVNSSAYLDEAITSGFVRLDGSFFRNRLTIATGVRFQNYKIRTEAGEENTLARYLYDDDGEIVLNPATGVPIVLGGSAIDLAQKTLTERTVHSQRTVRGYYPSINAAYRLTDNLYVRANFGNSINYPDMNNLIARTNISALTANPRRLTANTPLEPWTAHNYDLDLEYYTPGGGSFTLAWFRKDISNFITNRVFFAGTPEAAAALERLGYGQLVPFGYEVVEKYNEGKATLDGWEFAFDQTLDRYLPEWGRGLRVFYNTSYKAAPKGLRAGDLGAFSQRLMNWGVSYRRGPFGTHLKWNHVPEPKWTIAPGPTSLRPGSKTYLDVDVSYQFHRKMAFFASANNVMGKQRVSYRYTDNTPDYARMSQHQYYGVAISAGVKGQF